MEASLLPSERIRTLTQKAVVAAARKADPACDALRKEFEARATGWVIVLDPKGELLDSWMADGSGSLKNKESAARFAELFADKVEASLRRTETLQDLERRWEKDSKGEAAFEALASRLEELSAYARLRTLCTKVSALPEIPADRRSDALLRAFIVRPREYGALGTPDADAKFIEEGERLISDHAAQPKASRALEVLLQSGYGRGFDLPGKSAAGLARLEKAAEGLKDPVPLRARIGELSKLREKEIEKLRSSRAAAKAGEFNEAWYASALGDAEATIRFFSNPPHDKSAYYQRLVTEAREKVKAQNPIEKYRRLAYPARSENFDKGWQDRVAVEFEIINAGDLPSLRAALKDKDPLVRSMAARALGILADKESADALAELATSDPEYPVRIRAVESLGFLKMKPEAIERAKKDANHAVKWTARMAAEQLEKETDYAALIREAFAPGIAREAMGSAQVGKPAPDFTLRTTDGKTFKLSDLLGKKPIAIYFAAFDG